MATNEHTQTTDDRIRETFEEYVIRGETVAMIADPEHTHAWIQSSLTTEVEP